MHHVLIKIKYKRTFALDVEMTDFFIPLEMNNNYNETLQMNLLKK